MIAGFFVRAAAAAALLCVCAGAGAADPIPVYDATQVALDRYTVINRLGVQDWRSSIRIPGHPDVARARQALLNEAARLGADGVVNLHCLSQTDDLFKPAGYYCYGNAIKLKNERRVKG